MNDVDSSLSKYHRCLTESKLPTLRGFSPHQGDMHSLNMGLRRDNPVHNTGFGFAGSPLLGTGLSGIPTESSMKSPVNLLAYRPRNLNIRANTLTLPGGAETVVLDPRYTSLAKLKRFNKKADYVQKKMRKKLMTLMGLRQYGKNPYKDKVDDIVRGYSNRIAAHQDDVLKNALMDRASIVA